MRSAPRVLPFASRQARCKELLARIAVLERLRATLAELRLLGESRAVLSRVSLSANIEAARIDRVARLLGLPPLMLMREIAAFAREQLGDRRRHAGQDTAGRSPRRRAASKPRTPDACRGSRLAIGALMANRATALESDTLRVVTVWNGRAKMETFVYRSR